MAGALFWLSDAALAAIEPHLPQNQPGARQVDDRRVISGIVHMLRLVRVLPRWASAPIPVTVLYRTDVAPPRRVTAFVEFLFEVGANSLS